jgi:tetratricopeptide (TPR) repeat protein
MPNPEHKVFTGPFGCRWVSRALANLGVWCGVSCLVWLCGCSQYTAYQHLDQALQAEAKGAGGRALNHLKTAVELQPEDAYLLRRLGWIYIQRREFDAAFLTLQAALALEPAYLAAYQDLATLSDARNDFEGVIGWLEGAVGAVPGYRASYRDLANAYLRLERFQEAQLLLAGVVDRWPDATWAYFRLGRLYLRINLPDEAIESFQKVIALEPVSDPEYAIYVEAHGALGNVYYGQEDYELAAEFFKKAIDLNPADHSSMNNLAWLYATQKVQLAEGIHLSRRSLRLKPDSPTYLDTLAELYFVTGESSSAVTVIRQAIALDPDQPELRAHLRRQLARFLTAGQGKV